MLTDRKFTDYVVAIGSSTFDISATSTISMQVHDPCPCKRVVFKAGGHARNTAENLAALGCKCSLISAWGDDEHGGFLAKACQQAGIDISASRICAGHPTGCVVIVNDCDGETHSMVGEISVEAQITPQWLQARRALLAGARALVVDAGLSKESLAWLFTHHGEQAIFVDSVASHLAPRLEPWLPRIHTLKANRANARLLAGLSFSSREQAPSVAQWFIGAGVKQVVLSMGRHGFYYRDADSGGWMAAPAVKVVNVTGAGDALLAGLVYGWLHAMPLAESACFARGCAALALMSELNVHPALSAPIAAATGLPAGPSRPGSGCGYGSRLP